MFYLSSHYFQKLNLTFSSFERMTKNRMNGSATNAGSSPSPQNNNTKSQKRQKSLKSHSSLEAGDSRVDRDEIRSVLVRHWTSLDRARLHTFHLWLFMYALAQIFLFHYLCHRVRFLHVD